jgi:hypothetical protein
MGRTTRRQNFESKRFRAEAILPFWPRRSALKGFLRAQASQPIEKGDSGREIPRKSKQNEPSSKAHFATEARLADDIQMSWAIPDLAAIGEGANFSLPAPCKLLKINDRRRFAAENGGKRRRPSAAIPAVCARSKPLGRPSRGAAAPPAIHSTQPDRTPGLP